VRGTRGGGKGGLLGLGSGRTAKVEASGAFVLRGMDVARSTRCRRARPSRRASSASGNARARTACRRAPATRAWCWPTSPRPRCSSRSSTRARARRWRRFTVESGIDWPAPLQDDRGNPRTLFPGGQARVGGLRPSSEQERVQLSVRATGYKEYHRDDIAVRAGQELDLGPIYWSRRRSSACACATRPRRSRSPTRPCT
jgi:hypothetical protein